MEDEKKWASFSLKYMFLPENRLKMQIKSKNVGLFLLKLAD